MKIMPIESYMIAGLAALLSLLCVVMVARRMFKIGVILLGLVTVIVWLFPERVGDVLIAGRQEYRSVMHKWKK